jgi:hypothetical protein
VFSDGRIAIYSDSFALPLEAPSAIASQEMTSVADPSVRVVLVKRCRFPFVIYDADVNRFVVRFPSAASLAALVGRQPQFPSVNPEGKRSTPRYKGGSLDPI